MRDLPTKPQVQGLPHKCLLPPVGHGTPRRGAPSRKRRSDGVRDSHLASKPCSKCKSPRITTGSPRAPRNTGSTGARIHKSNQDGARRSIGDAPSRVRQKVDADPKNFSSVRVASPFLYLSAVSSSVHKRSAACASMNSEAQVLRYMRPFLDSVYSTAPWTACATSSIPS